MTPKAFEAILTVLQSVEQVQPGDASGRPLADFTINCDHDSRSKISLHDTGSNNSNHALMPLGMPAHERPFFEALWVALKV